MGERTEQACYACVRQLGEFTGKAPDLISPEEIRQYCIHLKAHKKVARQTSTQAICAIKLFWEKTLKRQWPHELELVRANPQFKLPVVFSATEVRRVLAAVSALDHRACLTTIDSRGLRLGQGLRLEVRETDAAAWLERQQARLLLPVPYFLLTFTVPEALRRFIRSHLQIALDLFFAVTAKALQDLAGNPRRLGAQLGMLGVLHTWSRTLIFHPHIHYLIPGGGLSLDGRTWVAARKQFLLHHKALGAHVRTLFNQRLRKEHPQLWTQVPAAVWKTPWNVGAQAAGSGQDALRYLSRYIFKTATSNRPVQLLPEGKLLWTYRQSKTRKFTSLKLEPLEFMSRFLQHTLPRGFARVRTFGWLHPAAKVRANRVRALLREKPLLTDAEKQTWRPPAEPTLQPPPPVVSALPCTPRCPRCLLAMTRIGSWRAGQAPLRPRPPP